MCGLMVAIFSSIGDFEVAGAGVYLPASELAFDALIWGTTKEYGDARLGRCRAFLPVPGVMQTVQRAEFWGAILAVILLVIFCLKRITCFFSRITGRDLQEVARAKKATAGKSYGWWSGWLGLE